MSETPECCYIPCDDDADYLIIDGQAPDDFTHACIEHLGHLIDHDKIPASVFLVDHEDTHRED